MIYVHFREEADLDARLALASQTIDSAFDDIPLALEAAAKYSAEVHPDFWIAANQISLPSAPLIVYAVRYFCDTDLPTYEISWNPLFLPLEAEIFTRDFQLLPVRIDLPSSDEVILLKRIGPMDFSLVA